MAWFLRKLHKLTGDTQTKICYCNGLCCSDCSAGIMTSGLIAGYRIKRLTHMKPDNLYGRVMIFVINWDGLNHQKHRNPF